MNCDEVVRELPMYGYGEIPAEIEERVEAHLADCTSCREELARYRGFLDVLDERADASAPGLLTTCRADLRRQIKAEAARGTGWNWLESLRGLSQLHIPFRIPVGAMALVAI
jgi:anti-sigma factor RsiW